MKKKLLLVQPRNDRAFTGNVVNGKAGMVSLALPTVAALTPLDREVAIHDARAEPVDYDRKVDLAALSAVTAQAPSACEIADNFRAVGKNRVVLRRCLAGRNIGQNEGEMLS